MTIDLPSSITEVFPDSKIAHYDITGVVGKGGQGIVLKLENGDGKVYTGKVIKGDWDKPQYDEALRQLRRGVELTQYLDHPRIQTVEEVIQFKDKERFVVVKEYAPGISLREMIKEKGHIPPEELVPIIDGLLEATEYLHDESQHPNVGVVCHRDIKPENVIIDEDGYVRLIDLDASKPSDEMLTSVTAPMGTKDYCSPEGLLGESSPQSDLFMVGFTGTEASIGYLPKELKDSRAGWNPEYSPPNFLPEELGAVLKRLVRYRPDDRFQSATDARKALGTFSLEKIVEEETLEIIVEEDEEKEKQRQRDIIGYRKRVREGENKIAKINWGIASVIFPMVAGTYIVANNLGIELSAGTDVLLGVGSMFSFMYASISGMFHFGEESEYNMAKNELYVLEEENFALRELKRKLVDEKSDRAITKWLGGGLSSFVTLCSGLLTYGLLTESNSVNQTSEFLNFLGDYANESLIGYSVAGLFGLCGLLSTGMVYYGITESNERIPKLEDKIQKFEETNTKIPELQQEYEPTEYLMQSWDFAEAYRGHPFVQISNKHEGLEAEVRVIDLWMKSRDKVYHVAHKRFENEPEITSALLEIHEKRIEVLDREKIQVINYEPSAESGIDFSDETYQDFRKKLRRVAPELDQFLHSQVVREEFDSLKMEDLVRKHSKTDIRTTIGETE